MDLGTEARAKKNQQLNNYDNTAMNKPAQHRNEQTGIFLFQKSQYYTQTRI